MQVTEQRLQKHDPFTIALVRYTKRDPHPGGQEAFTIHVQFPWHPRPLCRIKLKITHDEPVMLPPVKRALYMAMTNHSRQISQPIPWTKLLPRSCGLCCRPMLNSRHGAGIALARDYYDLWRILGTYRDELDLIRIRQCLSAKCAARDVSYAGLDDFLLHYWSVKRIDPGRATLVPSCVIFPRVIKCFKNYVSAWRR